MEYKQHCKDCDEALGASWYIVHRWLDEYVGIYWPNMIHRVHRHHKEGVEEVREKWGDQAAQAAEMHIKADLGCDEVPSREEVEKKYLKK